VRPERVNKWPNSLTATWRWWSWWRKILLDISMYWSLYSSGCTVLDLAHFSARHRTRMYCQTESYLYPSLGRIKEFVGPMHFSSLGSFETRKVLLELQCTLDYPSWWRGWGARIIEKNG
jgi:hypothetical protein